MRFGGVPTIRTRVGEVGTWGIGASRAAAIPQMRDFQTFSESKTIRRRSRALPGGRFTKRQKPPNHHSKGRLLKR
jgi:hypothetical protein